jgi:hypothetical protein
MKMSGELWSDDRIETLRSHLLQGRTYSEISRLMNTTRNVIAGKIHRLGKRPERSVRATTSSRKPRKVVPMKRPDPAPEPLLAPGEWPVSRNQCRWINGDPRGQDFQFCGHETVGIAAYCSYHVAKMYQSKN